MAKQNEVWKGVLNSIDLKERIPQITEELYKKTGFVPNKLLSTRSWWNESTGVGAFHLKGKFEGKSSVLKVQGVKPQTSEVFMIESFKKQSESKIVRPPIIYANFPWDDKKGYEAFIIEDVGNNLVVSLPTNDTDLESFFKYFIEYRSKCRNKPWLEKPDIQVDEFIKSRFDQWIKTSQKVFPNHPLRESGDEKLIRKAVEILSKNKKWLTFDFVHGHFSARDLFKVDNQIVLLSNLYWSWRTPYYDLVFAYHWFMYALSSIESITPKDIEHQRNIWMEKMEQEAEDKTLLKYALLERSAAGLNLDALSMNTTKKVTKYIVEKNREILKDLVAELS